MRERVEPRFRDPTSDRPAIILAWIVSVDRLPCEAWRII